MCYNRTMTLMSKQSYLAFTPISLIALAYVISLVFIGDSSIHSIIPFVIFVAGYLLSIYASFRVRFRLKIVPLLTCVLTTIIGIVLSVLLRSAFNASFF
jgi:hypothetical protein